ncbi:MAG: hypothetical protein SFU56_08700 [Capsulimonadales bacterium]|nr:hypothetical protein [Capsulimonadales bacterium]
MTKRSVSFRNRLAAAVLAVHLLLPLLAAPVSAQIFTRKQESAQPRRGMSTGKKVLLLSGAALLYFLWRKHQANAERARNVPAGQTGNVAGNGRTPQLYRSRNGGIYYRDANGRPVWLTVPNQGMQVPTEEVQRYAPNYRQYRGEAPAAPSGYRTQPFSDFDDSMMSSGAVGGPRTLR